MGNGEWGMGNGDWDWELGRDKVDFSYAPCPMPYAQNSLILNFEF
ncbi:hypothetical protein [Nostoc sp. CMAA1605]|nr:hypothetical protein [Nostoc sp. CMAA1605]